MWMQETGSIPICHMLLLIDREKRRLKWYGMALLCVRRERGCCPGRCPKILDGPTLPYRFPYRSGWWSSQIANPPVSLRVGEWTPPSVKQLNNIVPARVVSWQLFGNSEQFKPCPPRVCGLCETFLLVSTKWSHSPACVVTSGVHVTCTMVCGARSP
jgi:hypothetical protein